MTIPQPLMPYFKALSILGVLLVLGDVWLSGRFGYTLGFDLMFIVGAISLASGLLPVVCVYFYRAGHKPLAGIIAGAWVFAFVFNCFSNMGVSTANRMADVQRATVQQTNYDGAKANVDEAKRSLELFTGQLAKLLEANAWAGTVTADGLRAQVDSLKSAEASESRLGGCGRKCRAIQNEISEVQGKIAVAEQRATLTKQIEATKAVIAKTRTQLAGTDKGISNAANQSKLYAKLISWNLVLDPDAGMMTASNEVTGIATAIVLALIAAAVTLAGAWPHLMAVGHQAMHTLKSVGEQDRQSHPDQARAYPAQQEVQIYRKPAAVNFGMSTSTIGQLRRMAGQAA